MFCLQGNLTFSRRISMSWHNVTTGDIIVLYTASFIDLLLDLTYVSQRYSLDLCRYMCRGFTSFCLNITLLLLTFKFNPNLTSPESAKNSFCHCHLSAQDDCVASVHLILF